MTRHRPGLLLVLASRMEAAGEGGESPIGGARSMVTVLASF